ncbi:transposase (ISH3) [Haloferax prahovense DSM 18310]|uniref:Transposase (ISH3) n=1 Tax=Haloferax prahovense (strain DSM 18310 / JCM 13924 / TL6) TaxID=1227461 RepID=M0G9C4_HALPT|nr:transposase (ISH3) [Haloferax prahovense DSM 18310]
MFKTQYADGSIHEDQLLNFLVNDPDEEVALTLGENDELDAEGIYEVLAGACADGTSVSMLCERSEDAPHKNSILYHLRTKFDLEILEQVINTLLQKDVLDVLPSRLRPFRTSTCGPTMETKTTPTVSITPKRGTIALHATFYARVKNKRYTLAVRRLTDGDTAISVLAEFLGILDGLNLDVKVAILTAISTIASV